MNKNLKVVPIQRSPAYVHHRAMLNRRDNNIVDAVELLRRAVEESPQNREYRLDLAELYCEMGCHEQSARLLLDMLAEGDGPSECYYGLALNQLGMNDVPGARSLLGLYRRKDPVGARVEEVRQLAAELDFYSEIGRSASRKLGRASRIADRACDAMKADMPQKACRLFERSLALASEQYEMRALYAMALLISGDAPAARREAERASGGYPPSVRALCVSAQVFALLGETETARELIGRAAAEKPEGQELRLMVYAMGEMQLDADVAEYTRLALQETPFDRDLLHMRAVAMSRTGAPDAGVARFWTRILRIDPDDSIARFYQRCALNGSLRECGADYGYQVPPQEFMRRLRELVGHLSMGFEHIEAMWREDSAFRQLLRWAIGAEDGRLSRAAMTVLAVIDSGEARSMLRALLFMPQLAQELKAQAMLALRAQSGAAEKLMPRDSGLADSFMPGAEILLARLGVGERQLVRYADEVLSKEYGVSALAQLALMWTAYRQLRGTHTDPLLRIEAAAAALAYNYLLLYGPKPDIEALARAFNCVPRQLVYYARRIAGCVERLEIDRNENL
ncbi:MAG: tetratricopeptide repeat protein [Clostridia bacterium]|nr:tetratricopeptide repeat protein [Clostridia bacterium]